MGSIEEHQELVNDILLEFGRKATLWANNTGKAFRGKRLLSFGLKGSGDIAGILQGGKAIYIEVKTGNAKQTKDQKNFERMVLKREGIYILARSLEDVRRFFDERKAS